MWVSVSLLETLERLRHTVCVSCPQKLNIRTNNPTWSHDYSYVYLCEVWFCCMYIYLGLHRQWNLQFWQHLIRYIICLWTTHVQIFMNTYLWILKSGHSYFDSIKLFFVTSLVLAVGRFVFIDSEVLHVIEHLPKVFWMCAYYFFFL